MRVCVSSGMHSFTRNVYGSVGITGTEKLDGRLFGVTPVLDLAVSYLPSVSQRFTHTQTLMLSQERCHQC